VKIEAHLVDSVDLDILREFRADRPADLLRCHPGIRHEVGHLTERVYARVGPPCSVDLNVLSKNPGDGLVEGALHGPHTGLSLPAVEVRPVVFQN
jgi:hypothetical protein